MHEVIRQAGLHDAETLAALIRNSFQDVAMRFGLTPANCPTHPSNCMAQWLERDLGQGKHYFILELDRQPVGCIAIACPKPPTGQIERLAVLPDLRRRGYGDQLLRHALQALRDLGMSRAELAIVAGHVDLQAWYERRGFEIARSAEFAHLPFRVIFMSKPL